jgi:hypothetical protein
MNGLIIRVPWITHILTGRKSWEIRGSKTNIRGRIALIRSGSGLVVGTCDLVDCIGPLTLGELRGNASKAALPASTITKLPYPKTYAWVLKDAKKLRAAQRYEHPPGAVIWVKLPLLMK